MPVDQKRFEELDRKRFESGLTQEEADELGRMMAEREGKPYANAEGLAAEEEQPEVHGEGGQERDEDMPRTEDELQEWRKHPDSGQEERTSTE